MTAKEHLDARLAALRGREFVFQAKEQIGKTTIKRFAASIADFNPLYWDEEYAKKAPYNGIVAPPTLVFELNYDIGAEIDEETGMDKTFEELFPCLKDIQRTKNEYEIFQLVRPDDTITFRHKIIDVTQKQGRRGTWNFITSKITYTNQKGELLGTNEETIAGKLREES